MHSAVGLAENMGHQAKAARGERRLAPQHGDEDPNERGLDDLFFGADQLPKFDHRRGNPIGFTQVVGQVVELSGLREQHGRRQCPRAGMTVLTRGIQE